MFPGGRSSQNMPGESSRYPSSYYRDVAAVSDPTWFGNNPTPVPPPGQYPSRVGSGRDLLAESYERMRNEMRSLQGTSASKYSGGQSAPLPPPMEEQVNPLTQLLENKDVSLSSLLEAAMDPSIGSSKRMEDPIMKKKILDKCEGKIAQLYRLRISGQGMFFPITQPQTCKFDGVTTLTYNHPRIEFNMVPEETVWMCPDVAIEAIKKETPVETKDESEEKEIRDAEKPNAQKEKERDRDASNPIDKIEVLEPRVRKPPVVVIQQQQQKQQQQQLLPMVSQQPPPVANVSYPALSQYRSIPPPVLPYSVPPPVIPNSGQFPMETLAEMEKERRRKEIEVEWDRLMEDKEQKEKKRKKKKRSRSRSSSSDISDGRRSRSRHGSHSRERSRHRRSRSRRRSHGRSKDERYRRRSRSLSLSPSPPRKRSMSRLRVDRRYRRSPSPRVHRRSPSFLRSLQRELHRELVRSPQRYRQSPPRYRQSPPPREEYPPLMSLCTNPPPNFPQASPSQPVPPGFDAYYDYGAPANPPPPGMDEYGTQYTPGMTSYGPMGPGPHSRPWMDPFYGPPVRAPGQWMGPGPSPQWFGPQPHMGPRGPMQPNMQRPPIAPRLQTPPVVLDKKVPNNLIDLTQREATARPTEKKPIAIVDITDNNEKPPVDSAKVVNQKLEVPKGMLEPDKPKPADNEAEKSKLAENEAEQLVVNKAKVISNIVPPGVSPDRETHTKYPNVESEFTRPMRAAFRKMLEPLEKVLDKIRFYQRDSFDFKTLIKSLESGKIEFMGVHTLHDGLLCKLEINRKQPDKFFKIVLPFTHVGRVLRAIHSSYHDYSIGRIQRLIDDLFSEPRDFPLAKIVSVIKQCKECIEAEEKERENLRKKEILILSSPEQEKMPVDEPLSDAESKVTDDPMVKPHRERQRQRSPDHENTDRKRQKEERSRRHSDAEKEGKSRKVSERDFTEKRGGIKNKSPQKSPLNEGENTYSKFEELSVSRKTDEIKKSHGEIRKPNNSVGQKGRDASKRGVPLDIQKKDGKTDDKGGESSKNGKKVPVGLGKIVSKNDEVNVSVGNDQKLNQKKPITLDRSSTTATVTKKESGDLNQAKSTNTAEPQPKPQQKPVVNPDDFKERVRTVQMGVAPLESQIIDLEGLGKKSSDPALLLKAGMLCRRLSPPKGIGKPEVKIVVTPACLKEMVEIVHTMAALHAPLQKTVTVFKKHFVPIDGLEKAVSEVLNNCAKCSSDVKK